MTHSCSSLDGMRLASSTTSSISDSLQSGAKQSQPASRAVASTSGSALGASGADLENLFASYCASRNSKDEDDDAHFGSEASCLSKRCAERGDSGAGRDSLVARSLASAGDEGHHQQHQQHQQVENVQLSTGSGSSVSFATDRISSCSHASWYSTGGGMAGYGKLGRPFSEEEVAEVIIGDGGYEQEEVVPVLVEVRGTASSRDVNNRSPLDQVNTECAGAGTGQKENAHDSTHQLDNHQPVTKSVAKETDLRQLRIGGTDSARPVLSQRNVCDVCGKQFPSPSALTDHYRTHTGEKPFKCDVCHAAFAKSSALSRHYRTHTGEKPFKCDVCGAAFTMSSSLTVHYRTHTGEKPYKCDVCDAAFSQSSHLTDHYRTHTGEKPYKCDVCDAAFSKSSTLSRHYRTHTGEKPYKCDVCHAAFAKSNTLTVHYRTHTGEKPYKCDVCDAAFAKSSNLTAHYRTHTGEKPYKCDVCDAVFVDSSHLTIHYRTHTGEKPYKCDVCDAAFVESRQLTAHYRTHTGEKPYKCDLCGRSFSLSGSLSRHCRLIHS